jgi:hypothetical protein
MPRCEAWIRGKQDEAAGQPEGQVRSNLKTAKGFYNSAQTR